MKLSRITNIKKNLISDRLLSSGIMMRLFSLILGFSLVSCIDDNIIVNENDEISDTELSDNALTLYFETGDGFSTRYVTNSDVESNDSYIRKYRVKFFDAKTDNFLFDSDIFYNPSLDNTSKFEIIYDDNGNEIYKTRIEIGNLTDGNGHSIAKLIRDWLIKHSFKVAFLANMGNEGRTAWGFQYSYLNPNSTEIKTINDLHFLFEDVDYSGKYPFLAKDNMVSDNVNWVQERSTTLDYNVDPSLTETTPAKINNENNASKWIKKYWDPLWDKNYQNKTQQKPVYREYVNLWQYWNFGGSTYADDHKLSYKKLWNGTDFVDNWKKRNANSFKDSQEWFFYDDFWFNNKSYYENDGLWVVQNITHHNPGDASTYVRITKTNGYGIILPKADGLSDTKDNNDFDKYLYYRDLEDNFGYGCIRFIAPSSGNLRIKYNSLYGNETKLRIQRSSNPILDASTSSKGTSYQDIELSIKITGDPEPIFIYNVSNNPAVVYAIEYISDTHLYETNWEGLKPLPTKAIPMYGVEEFDAVGIWNNGQIIDLRSKPVALIRSVAKVVVNLPKRAKAVYMRSMNSNAANEPGDVSTPTSITWKESHKASSKGEEDCEWFRIQAYKPWYQSGLSNHDTWMKWFYGSWKLWRDDYSESFYTEADPPHIFNASIIRSDFCEFIYVGEVNGYHRYVLYTPDKAVDDPNSWDNPNSSPKIIHIEYRYETDTSNFDDNSCYRIYFTDYKTNEEIKKQTRDTYDSYEQNNANLQKHWPILRNHVYTFNVSESNTTLTDQNINVRINPWGYNENTVEESW